MMSGRDPGTSGALSVTAEGAFRAVTEYGFRQRLRATAERTDPVIDRRGRGRLRDSSTGLNAEAAVFACDVRVGQRPLLPNRSTSAANSSASSICPPHPTKRARRCLTNTRS